MHQLRHTIFFLVLFVFLFTNTSIADNYVHLAVLKSDNLVSTKRAISGAKSIVRKKYENVVFHEFLIDQSSNSDKEIIDTINSHIPTLILTIGTNATFFAQEHFKKFPVVFSSVRYPVLSGIVKSMNRPGGNITGASLNIPNDVQFRTLVDIIPNIQNIGVLYSDYTKDLITSAAKTVKKIGLNLIAIPVNQPKDLPSAVDSLIKSCQGIWSVADPNLFNSQSTRYILLNSIRKGIPFMGFSRHVVESGALFALDLDHKGVGRQAGHIIIKVIEGEKPGNIPVSLVDLIWFHYNEKTASHIDIIIPDKYSAVAKKVYR